MPKPSPKKQNTIPISSSLWPSIALFRKLTEERSGSFSAASPPPASSAGCASAHVVVTNSKVARARDALAIPRLADAKWAVQVRITILLRISIQGLQRVLLLRLFGVRRHFHSPRKRPPPEF